MGQVVEIIGAILILMGSFFFVVGAIGIYRMPDVFTRMHAAGISDTAGAGLLLIGMMCFGGLTLVTIKLAIILAVIWFTSPIGTHALAQAALHAGLEPILADKRVMIGTKASKEPATARPEVKKAASKAAAKAPLKRTSGKARSSQTRKRRKRS